MMRIYAPIFSSHCFRYSKQVKKREENHREAMAFL